MAQIPRSFRSMPPRVPAETPWVRGAAPAPVAAAPMPAQLDDLPFDPPTAAHVAPVVEPVMTFLPNGGLLLTDKERTAAYEAQQQPELGMAPVREKPKASEDPELEPAPSPETVAALNAKYPETPDDALRDLLDEVELTPAADPGYTQVLDDDEDEDEEVELTRDEDAGYDEREPPEADEKEEPEYLRAPPAAAPELVPDIPYADLSPLGMAPPRRPPPVPPTPPSSGLMSSPVGTVSVPVRRPPISPLSTSTPPATGRDD